MGYSINDFFEDYVKKSEDFGDFQNNIQSAPETYVCSLIHTLFESLGGGDVYEGIRQYLIDGRGLSAENYFLVVDDFNTTKHIIGNPAGKDTYTMRSKREGD